MLVSPRAKPRQADKDRAADIPDSVHPFWFNNSWSRLVAGQFGVRSPKPGYGKNFATISGARQFHCPRTGVRQNGHWGKGIMDECVYCRPPRGDSGLVVPELSVGGTESHHRGSRGANWRFVLLLFGCGLFVSACANDSADDNGGSHRHHRHGNGHGREQTETIDRSSNPSPTPALGW